MAKARIRKGTASVRKKKITAKQRVARKKNIEVARRAKKKGGGRMGVSNETWQEMAKSNPKPKRTRNPAAGLSNASRRRIMNILTR